MNAKNEYIIQRKIAEFLSFLEKQKKFNFFSKNFNGIGHKNVIFHSK